MRVRSVGRAVVLLLLGLGAWQPPAPASSLPGWARPMWENTPSGGTPPRERVAGSQRRHVYDRVAQGAATPRVGGKASGAQDEPSKVPSGSEIAGGSSEDVQPNHEAPTPTRASAPASSTAALGTDLAPPESLFVPVGSEAMKCWFDLSPWGVLCDDTCPRYTRIDGKEPEMPNWSGRLEISGDGRLSVPEGAEPALMECSDGATRTLFAPSEWLVEKGQVIPLSPSSVQEDDRQQPGPRRALLVPPLNIWHVETRIVALHTVGLTFVLVAEGSAMVVAPPEVGVNTKLKAGEALEVQFAEGRWWVEQYAGQGATNRLEFLRAEEGARRGRADRGEEPAFVTLTKLAGPEPDGTNSAALAREAISLGPDLAPTGLFTAAAAAFARNDLATARTLAAELTTGYPTSGLAAYLPRSVQVPAEAP